MTSRSDTADREPHEAGASGLKPVLGYRDLVLFYLVVIFSVRLVPGVAAIGPSAVVLWLLALLLFFVPMAVAVIDLSRRFPGEGGIYIWTKRAFGDFHGFMVAWIYWTVNLVYFPPLLLFTASQAAYVIPGHSDLADSKLFLTLFAAGAMVVIFLLNFVGFRVSTWFHDISAASRFAIVALLIGLGASSWIRFGSATDLSFGAWVPSLGKIEDLVFLAGVVYMLTGVESASTFGDEVKNPRKNIPRAIVTSGVLVTLLYVLATMALMVAVPAEDLSSLKGFTEMVAVSAERLGGGVFSTWATSIAAFLLCVMLLGIASGWFATGARLPFVVGLDRYLPAIFGHVNRRFGSPDVALGSLALVSILFIVLSNLGGTISEIYATMISLEIVAFLFVYLYLFAALLRLEPGLGAAGGERTPGARRVALAAGGVGFLVTVVAGLLAVVPGGSVENPTAFYLAVFGSLALNLLTAVGLYRVALWRRARASSVRA